jgi:penicillin-binding protein A
VIDAYNRLLESPDDPLINRTMNGNLNPPGSTFKLVVASAAFESGRFTAENELPNPANLQLPQSDSIISNADEGTCGPGENTTIATALRLSCNIPFAELGLELGTRTIRDQANLFGFNETIDVPMTSTESVYPRALDEPQTMLSAFGQSSVRASPLQMAMVSMAIANGGTLMKPTLVESIIAPDQSELVRLQPEVFRQSISGQTAATMTELMIANINNGAASGARIGGVDVAGKTGTAENDVDDPYTLWFTGFAPANDPQVVVAVVVENGGGLGQAGTSNGIAAPIARQVLEAVLFR